MNTNTVSRPRLRMLEELFAREERRGRRIFARWESGSNYSRVRVFARDESGREETLETTPADDIAQRVCHNLELADGRPEYFSGEGEASLSSDRLFLRYSSRRRRFSRNYNWLGRDEYSAEGRLAEWDSEFERERGVKKPARDEVRIAMRSELEALSKLHRADIFLVGEMDQAGNTHEWVHSEVINGDEFILPSDVINYYRERIREALRGRMPSFQRMRKRPVGLYMEARLGRDAKIVFRVLKDAYASLALRTNELMELKE